MAGSVNKVILIGNLGQDPEVKSFQNGGRIANLRIATSENWKDKNTGERKEKTEWHSVAIFNENLANTAERFLRKGSKVYIEGQLERESDVVNVIANDVKSLVEVARPAGGPIAPQGVRHMGHAGMRRVG